MPISRFLWERENLDASWPIELIPPIYEHLKQWTLNGCKRHRRHVTFNSIHLTSMLISNEVTLVIFSNTTPAPTVRPTSRDSEAKTLPPSSRLGLINSRNVHRIAYSPLSVTSLYLLAMCNSLPSTSVVPKVKNCGRYPWENRCVTVTPSSLA